MGLRLGFRVGLGFRGVVAVMKVPGVGLRAAARAAHHVPVNLADDVLEFGEFGLELAPFGEEGSEQAVEPAVEGGAVVRLEAVELGFDLVEIAQGALVTGETLLANGAAIDAKQRPGTHRTRGRAAIGGGAR